MNSETRRALDRDLAAVRDDLLRMGEMLDAAIRRALEAVEAGDRELAADVVGGDAHLNELRFKVEEDCLSMIATQQPAAGDLRAIIAAMNVVLDLERMGDHAAGIAKTVLLMSSETPPPLPLGLVNMADLSRRMLRESLEAYVAGDSEAAYAVAVQDDQMDVLYHGLLQDLLERTATRPESPEDGLYLLFAGHNLERIADRITNIAERVIFMASGQMQELNPEPPDELS